ncbi:MAG: bifunctional (p)ppGpp synthetase/guanosine-3',5'-bis(diphosphate) 3'-pyrophosphohydrolase, partial [Ktedonobacteraceae bacterium]|nr:bifunctional (p)ppGpp synthetase/guanosine-3',5'-bis(diphosphate) 3'-pyrophosphohydrolase [Ktedonobacteraceae bacterium]
EVAGMVMANGGSDSAVAAALLHDAIEDQGSQTRALIHEQLGEEVLALVEECTEQGTGGANKAPWRERKEAALARLNEVSLQALLIIVADKLHNAHELYRIIYVKGDGAYSLFRAGKENTLWFHQEVVRTIQQRIDTLKQTYPDEPLLTTIQCLQRELDDVVHALHAL